MSNDVKVLKLITGEEVIARVLKESGNLLILDKPMTLQILPPNQQGQVGFAIVPWLMAGNSEKITISTEHILAEDVVKSEIEKNYLANVTGLTL
tara:strand:+ start:60 stop:341 length:282 start_codon:yes stop_codon:yes gene_type:complete